VLAVSVRAPREPRRLVAAVGTAIAAVGALALLSRLHPSWFSSADQTAVFLDNSRERLSYPLNYWNGLGAFIAIGIPLVIEVAASARAVLARALAAAALPAMVLALFFTLSRGGIAAAVLGTIAYIVVASDRVPRLSALVLGAVGGGALIALAAERDALRHGLVHTDLGREQGDEVLLAALVICAAVALAYALVSTLLGEGRRPRWTEPSRAFTAAATGTLVIAVVVAFLAVGGPGRVSRGIDEFKGGANAGTGTGRLNSFAGESRYALWKSALSQNSTAPLTGTGSGTFVYWWDRDAEGGEAVQDAHSAYMQVLGELGIVGLLLFLGFAAVVLVGGALRAVRAGPGARGALAAAFAGCLAFLLTAAVDWSWHMPVLAVTMLILAAALVAGGDEDAGGTLDVLRGRPSRIGIGVASLAAIVLIAIPLASTTLVRSSEAAVREGDLDAALADARSAANVQPGAASPRLQEALVLELRGDLDAAAVAAWEATEREPTNWRPWLVLSRLEAKRGKTLASLRAYRKARSLNPLSPLFER